MCPVDQDAEALASIWLVFNDGDADRLRFSILRPRRQTLAEWHVSSIIQNPRGLPHRFRRALATPGAVVALGSGAVLDPGVQQLLAGQAVVYLEASFPAAWSRRLVAPFSTSATRGMYSFASDQWRSSIASRTAGSVLAPYPV